jgi:secretion/DNA translocation related TadE-like protein
VALSAAVLVCTSTAVVGGRLLADQRRAAAAADLAALAGAAAVQRGSSGCAAAEQVAVANGAIVTSCRVDGEQVRIGVRTDSVRLLGRLARPRAEARAGPTGP